MNENKRTAAATVGNTDNRSGQTSSASADSVEIELDTQELLALDAADAAQLLEDALNEHTLSETVTKLERDQTLDDLRNLSWPGLRPTPARREDK